MDQKLTLKLDKNIIDKAKKYAKQNNKSLSRIVETYFQFISEKDQKLENSISPLVEELTGIIKLDKNYNFKDDYAQHLMEKYE